MREKKLGVTNDGDSESVSDPRFSILESVILPSMVNS